MSKADELAQWLVSNKDKKGSPEWEAKAAEYRREADAESTKVSPQVQQQRDAERIKTLQEEFLKETDRLKQRAPGALDNLKALSAEIVAAGGKAPPIPAPPSKADEFKEIAGQALQETIQGAGEIARDVGPGAALGTAGLLTGVLEARGKGPASLIERGAQGARQGAARISPTPVAPPAAPAAPISPRAAPSGVTPPAAAAPSIVGPSGEPLRPPVGGTATEKWGLKYGLTPIEAQKAKDTTKQAGGAWDLVQKRREALNLIEERFPSDRFIENPRHLGIMTPEPSVGGGPRARYVMVIPEVEPARPAAGASPAPAPPAQGTLRALPPTQPIPTTPKPAGALEEVTQLFRKMAETGSRGASALGGVARALPVISYPLAGYSIGEDFGAIQEELAKERPDYADIALRGIGALGTGLSLHPATAPVGIPMATIPPLIAAGRRKMREAPKMPEATYQEMVEASRPSFRMSRP